MKSELFRLIVLVFARFYRETMIFPGYDAYPDLMRIAHNRKEWKEFHVHFMIRIERNEQTRLS